MRFTPPDGVLNLAQTLDCGQSFRFYPVTLENNIPAWRGVAFSRGLTVYQDENNDLVLDCTEQEFHDIWFDYFDFNTDYKKSREVLSALHPALKEAAEFAGGIRILKQEPFEALCSFIISQNNNIPRIKGIIERLCLHFGEPFLYHNETRYAFPTPKKLASCTPEDLAPLRAGFRAKYLIDAAKRIASGEIDLEAVRKMPLPDAKAKLQTISGVGPKVADCALLYGLHRTECFPMDVWMKRAVSLLPRLSPADFGENAGIAQHAAGLALVLGKCHEQMLGHHKAVAHLGGLLFGLFDDADELVGQAHLLALARNLGRVVDGILCGACELGRVGTDALDDHGDIALAGTKQGGQQVNRLHRTGLRVGSRAHGGLQRLARRHC